MAFPRLTPNEYRFLVSDSALAPLELTKDALLRIMTYHQVMPAYIDFLLAFGTQDEDRELRFTRFRTQTVLQNPVPGHVVADLHRSGRQHEICYNLKAVAPKDRGKSQYDRDQWKIRQAAVYHRFDLGSGTALWIVADPRESVKKAVQGVLREGPIPSNANMAFATMPDAFQSSLDTHLILVNWASTSWRWNIQSLEEAIDDMTRPMLLFDFKDSRQPDILPRSVTLVQEYEDKVNETLMVLESNIKICTSLQTSYTDLVEDENFPQNEKKACRSAVQKFSEQVQEYIFDLQMQADRARVLSKVASGRKTLALQQLQTQLAVKQEALATSMWQFSEQGQKEAIAMRIITVITLLYLPPTFVCTFFGTDVIKYQDGGQDAVYFSTAALKSFFEVTIPLWIITILVVYIFNKTESTKREKRALELVSRLPELWTPSSTGTTHQTSPHENKHNMLEKRHMQGH